MGNVGHPTGYKSEYCDQAYKLCLLGATDAKIADFFGVCEATINNWKLAHPEFLESLKRGKISADAEIAESLFHRGKGYSHTENKIFQYEGTPIIVPTVKHYPPDTAACMAWLKNRQPEVWRERQEANQSVESEVSAAITKLIESNPD